MLLKRYTNCIDGQQTAASERICEGSRRWPGV